MLKIKLLLSSICISMLLTVGTVFASEIILPKTPVVLDGVYYTSSEYQEYVISNKVEVKHFVLSAPDYIKVEKFIYAFTTDKGCEDFINVINKTIIETNESKAGNKYKTKLWTNPNHKGTKKVYERLSYAPTLPYSLNDEFESVKVGKKGGWLILYENANYQGATLSIREGTKEKDLNNFNWGGRASSLKTGQINPL